MNIFRKIAQILPQDKVSRIFSGFVGIMLVGIVGSVVVISIPDVRTQLSKTIGYGPISHESLQLSAFQPPPANPLFNFGVTKDEDASREEVSETQIWVKKPTTIYLHWNVDPTFDPENKQNKDANGNTKVPHTAETFPERANVLLGCWGYSGANSDIESSFALGKDPSGTKIVEWSGFFDENGVPAKKRSYVSAGVQYEKNNSSTSLKSPDNGFPIRIDSYGSKKFTIACRRFDVHANTQVRTAKVKIHVNKLGVKPAPPEALPQDQIDAINDQYAGDPDNPLTQPPSNLKAVVGCLKNIKNMPRVQFTWSNSIAQSILLDRAEYEIVVSNDPDFGALDSYDGPVLAGSGDSSNHYKIWGSGLAFAGQRTPNNWIPWSWSDGELFLGDSQPILSNQQANDINDVGGIGTQPGPGSGTFFWKVLTKTPYGTSDWVDGPSFTVNCDYDQPDQATATAFDPSKTPVEPLTPEDSSPGSGTDPIDFPDEDQNDEDQSSENSGGIDAEGYSDEEISIINSNVDLFKALIQVFLSFGGRLN